MWSAVTLMICSGMSITSLKEDAIYIKKYYRINMKIVFSESNIVIAQMMLFHSSGGLNGQLLFVLLKYHHLLRCFVLKFLREIILIDIFILIIF